MTKRTSLGKSVEHQWHTHGELSSWSEDEYYDESNESDQSDESDEYDESDDDSENTEDDVDEETDSESPASSSAQLLDPIFAALAAGASAQYAVLAGATNS